MGPGGGALPAAAGPAGGGLGISGHGKTRAGPLFRVALILHRCWWCNFALAVLFPPPPRFLLGALAVLGAGPNPRAHSNPWWRGSSWAAARGCRQRFGVGFSLLRLFPTVLQPWGQTQTWWLRCGPRARAGLLRAGL